MAVTINGTTGIDKVQDDSVDIADLSATGTASSSTYLRGDNTWATAGGATSLNGLSDATTSATSNLGLGANAVDSITTGDYNVGVGDEALTANTSAEYNVAIGYQAGKAITTGSYNTAVGTMAFKEATTAARNVAIGVSAGQNITDSEHNTAVGTNALSSNTTADYNTAVGSAAMTANTTGQKNTAVGRNALGSNTTGSTNTSVGVNAGFSNTTATHNVCIGWEAGYSQATGGSNTLIGTQAGRSLAGDGGAGGVNNVLIGYQAGYDATAYTGARWNVIIGDFCRGSSGNGQAEIVMGYNVASGSENRFTFGLGTSDSAINFGATSITAPSDERLKEDITTSTAGLSFIKDLRPVTYKWRQEKDIPDTMQAHVADSTTRFCNDKTNHGFVAQEVKAAIDAHPEIKDGFEMWDTDVQDGRQRIADGALVPILVKAIQELSAKNTALEARITTLEG